MLRVIRIFLALFALTVLYASVTASAQDSTPHRCGVRPNGNAINIREEPNGTVIGLMSQRWYRVIARTADDPSWYYIDVAPFERGYVSETVVITDGDCPNPGAKVTQARVAYEPIFNCNVSLRPGFDPVPLNRDLEVVGYLREGMYLEFSFFQDETHSRIQVQDQNGWDFNMPANGVIIEGPGCANPYILDEACNPFDLRVAFVEDESIRGWNFYYSDVLVKSLEFNSTGRYLDRRIDGVTLQPILDVQTDDYRVLVNHILDGTEDQWFVLLISEYGVYFGLLRDDYLLLVEDPEVRGLTGDMGRGETFTVNPDSYYIQNEFAAYVDVYAQLSDGRGNLFWYYDFFQLREFNFCVGEEGYGETPFAPQD